MIESDTRMSGILGNSGHHLSHDYRLLTTDPSQLSQELPGDLQSLSWLTSVDVPRLQQMATGRLGFSTVSHSGLLGQQTVQLNSTNTVGGQGTMTQLQNASQNGPLGMNTTSGHSGNLTGYSLNGQPSPGFQHSQVLYQQSPQQVFNLAQAVQQYSPSGLYTNPSSYNNHGQFNQPRLAPHSQDLHPTSFPKPIYSYSCLIAMALKNSQTGCLPVSEIYGFMKEHFPYFKTAPDGWKNSVRHNLSLNKCFEKVENKLSSSSRKGCLWALHPAKIDKMEEEMQKWKRKDLPAIRRSMANPDELDKLITDRPESCRRKPRDRGVPVLQPVATLSLQRHVHAQLAPGSPVPARTPPLHAVPDASHSSAAHHSSRPPHNLYSLHTDMAAEVDGLDPNILDFALHGNLWEEMRDETFSLETLGGFSQSSLTLSDCEVETVSRPPAFSASVSLSDLLVPGRYATYATLDTAAVVSSQYTGTAGAGRAIALL